MGVGIFLNEPVQQNLAVLKPHRHDIETRTKSEVSTCEARLRLTPHHLGDLTIETARNYRTNRTWANTKFFGNTAPGNSTGSKLFYISHLALSEFAEWMRSSSPLE